MVGSGEWSSGEELGQTWENRNAFSYGSSKSEEKGVKRTDLLRGLLNTTDRVIQEVQYCQLSITIRKIHNIRNSIGCNTRWIVWSTG